MGSIGSGRNRACKNSVSGYDTIYLFPWIKYSRSKIIVDGSKLITFPTTTIHAFSVYNATFTEPQTEDNGGKFYTQDITFGLPKIELNPEFLKLLNNDYRAIVKDRNGLHRIVGLYNGLISELNQTTGDTKNSFNGYNIQMTGVEILGSFFIDDLEDAGFKTDPTNYIFQNDDNYIYQNNNNYIFN